MEDKLNKTECIECQSYYIYYSTKEGKYVITNHSLEAFDNSPWLDLRNEPEKISHLIKLLQGYESLLKKNKANLSAQNLSKIDFKRGPAP